MNLDLVAILLTCSLHHDDRLLRSVIDAHSAGNPYTVAQVSFLQADSQDGPMPTQVPRSRNEAKSAAAAILASGDEVALGLLPVRPAWAVEFGRTMEDLFDPCSNVAVASAKMSEFDFACRRRARRQNAAARRSCTLDRYGTSLGLLALRVAVMADLSGGGPSDNPLVGRQPVSPTSTTPDPGIFFPVSANEQRPILSPLFDFRSDRSESTP